MPETSQGPAGGPAGHESDAVGYNDTYPTVEKCLDPTWQILSHTAGFRVHAVERRDTVHSLRLPETLLKGQTPPLFVQV